ncbi:MAG: cation transporter [Candidatus Marsarchaeota archaeon]|nr:cation transporter [Candidatus Marsarchaeota archaeon]
MTCGSCAMRVEQALLGVPGVSVAEINPITARVAVTYDEASVTTQMLHEVVERAGYGLKELAESTRTQKVPFQSNAHLLRRPVLVGMAASFLLASLYIAIVGIAQDFNHAFGLIGDDWYFVVPIVAGFGTQVGLFAYARARFRHNAGMGATKAMTGAGTGTSTISMVACCTHHLGDVLPIVGFSGASLFLNEYRGPLMALGILTNAIGIVVVLRTIRKAGQRNVPADPPSRAVEASSL